MRIQLSLGLGIAAALSMPTSGCRVCSPFFESDDSMCFAEPAARMELNDYSLYPPQGWLVRDVYEDGRFVLMDPHSVEMPEHAENLVAIQMVETEQSVATLLARLEHRQVLRRDSLSTHRELRVERARVIEDFPDVHNRDLYIVDLGSARLVISGSADEHDEVLQDLVYGVEAMP